MPDDVFPVINKIDDGSISNVDVNTPTVLRNINYTAQVTGKETEANRMAKEHKPDGTEEKKHLHLKDQLTLAYIRRIKKWMFCPACLQGKMTINKASTTWTCEECGYKLSADEFEDDYVFWFCDECNTYLNKQEGFDRQMPIHICQNCGYKNDITSNNIKGICSDCGKIIPDSDTTLCADCKQIRRQKAKDWLITAGKVVGFVAAAAGVVYLASKSSDDDVNSDNIPLPDDKNNDEGASPMSKYKVIFNEEEQDEVFDTEEEAEEYASYLCSCARTGAETLNLSNPGDYDYDEDSYEDPEYEIVEVE